MFNNIGYRIKVLAEVQLTLFSIGCFIFGIYLMSIDFVFLGILVFISGFICAPISAYLLYGFGELIDKVNTISENTRKDGFITYHVKNNINENVKDKSKVDYSGYFILVIVTLLISVIVALIAIGIMSSSVNDGAINATSAVVSIEYNDGQ